MHYGTGVATLGDYAYLAMFPFAFLLVYKVFRKVVVAGKIEYEFAGVIGRFYDTGRSAQRQATLFVAY